MPKISLPMALLASIIIVALLAVVIAAIPFAATLILLNMCFNKGKVSFINKPLKPIKKNGFDFAKLDLSKL